MPFPPSVRDKALLAAARHCCVCRRYKGVLIEVHHLIPQADGGSDNFDNAIALCFDCHAWAGHYFSKHPKGTKYSPDQLREAREAWYAKVEKGDVATPEDDSSINVKYLISRDVDVSLKILEGEFSAMPVPNTVLANNEFGKFISKAISLNQGFSPNHYGQSYESIDTYKKEHPDAQCSSSELEGYCYFDCIRNCTDVEFLNHISSRSKFYKALLALGAKPIDLCVIVTESGECGDGSIIERFLIRPIWAIFLLVTNATLKPISITNVTGRRDISENFRNLGSNNSAFILNMPKCEIAPSQSVLIPISMYLGPIQELGEEQMDILTLDDKGEFSEVMKLTYLPKSADAKIQVVGPSFIPQSISIKSSSDIFNQEIHQLNIENVYTIDRVWQCGSCPHLFSVSDSGEIQYVAELIAKGQENYVTDSVLIPLGISKVLITELEDELTLISEISFDGIVVRRDVQLKKGESIELDVQGVQTLSVTGAYFPIATELDFNHGCLARNKLICDFMSCWKQ